MNPRHSVLETDALPAELCSYVEYINSTKDIIVGHSLYVNTQAKFFLQYSRGNDTFINVCWFIEGARLMIHCNRDRSNLFCNGLPFILHPDNQFFIYIYPLVAF